MQDINAWLLSNQIYNDGFALYKKYGQSDFLKELLANGPTPFNQSKLVAELIKLAPATPAIQKESIKPKTILPITDKTEDLKQKAENHKLYLQLQEDNKSKYRQLERNMGMLDYSKEESILHQTAKQILILHRKIQENYKHIDFFDENGYYPFQRVKENITDEAQLIYQSLSKARKRLASGKCKNVAQTKSLIETKMARLAEINGKVEHA